jgi:hypothetical protein
MPPYTGVVRCRAAAGFPLCRWQTSGSTAEVCHCILRKFATVYYGSLPLYTTEVCHCILRNFATVYCGSLPLYTAEVCHCILRKFATVYYGSLPLYTTEVYHTIRRIKIFYFSRSMYCAVLSFVTLPRPLQSLLRNPQMYHYVIKNKCQAYSVLLWDTAAS